MSNTRITRFNSGGRRRSKSLRILDQGANDTALYKDLRALQLDIVDGEFGLNDFFAIPES